MRDKQSIIAMIKVLNGQLNMPAVLDYYGIDYDDDQEQFSVLCPFHNDHAPSLHVYTNNDTGQDSWCCYVCGTNGDCFRFIQGMCEGYKEANAVAHEIIKGIGGDQIVNPKQKALIERRRQIKKIQLLNGRLGIRYRDWLCTLKGHPQYIEACAKVDAIFEQLDDLMEAGEYQKAKNFIKERFHKLQQVRG